jgi:CheY-like chemotaxis protein
MNINYSLPALIVDDDRTTTIIVAKILERMGCHATHHATSSEQALEFLETFECGLIVSDWHMAPTGGIEFLCRVRSNPTTTHVPFVFLSGDDRVSTINCAKYAGADGYVVKPTTPQMLGERLLSAILERPARSWIPEVWSKGWSKDAAAF